MKNPETISPGQLTVLLTVCHLSDVLLFFPGDGVEQIWMIVLENIFRLLAACPLCRMLSDGWSIERIPDSFFGNTVCAVGGIWLLLSLGEILALTGIFVSETLYPDSFAVLFGTAVLFLGIYGAYMGMEAAARAALPVLTAAVVGIFLTALGVRQEIRLIHLRPVESWSAILFPAVRGAFRSPEILVLAAAGGRVKGKKFMPVWQAYALTAFLGAGCAFLSGSVLGGMQRREPWPFFEVQTLVKLSVFQYLDAWFGALWVLVIFIRAVFLLWSAEQFLVRFAGRREKTLPAVLGAAAFAAMSVMLQQRNHFSSPGARREIWIPFLLLLIYMPWRIRKHFRKGENG